MLNLIKILRGMTNTAINDYEVNGVSYWTEDHLERILDARRFDAEYMRLTPIRDSVGGTAVYTRYKTDLTHWEDSPIIKDAGNNVVSSGYTFDADRGYVVFANDTGGAVYTISGAVYDVDNAAADVWEMKAAYYAEAYDIAELSQQQKRSQIVSQCLRMAQMYRARAGLAGSVLYRGDLS